MRVSVVEDNGKSLKHLRVDHAGALRRPDYLERAYADYRAGTMSDAELRTVQERGVREVVAQQEGVGLPVVTDGELCRIGGFQESFGGAVSGFDAVSYKDAGPYRDKELAQVPPGAAGRGPVRVESGRSGPGPAIINRLPVKERLELVRNTILEEYRFAASLATAPVKVTLIGPDRISQRFEYENSRDVYRDMDEFLADVVAIERQMIEEVVAAGCRYVHIDEPGYTAYVDPILTEKMRSRGEDPRRNFERSIQADNAVIAGFPDVTFSVHICRGGGGGRGGWAFHREGHYDDIAEQLFNDTDFDRFILEYDGDHAGTFEPLRFMPTDKVAVLGLASNHGEPESPDYLRRRIDDAAGYVPVERLAISPRCGLSGIHSDEAQWQKLRTLVEVGAQVWGS